MNHTRRYYRCTIGEVLLTLAFLAMVVAIAINEMRIVP
jgi:hypothetical protein